MRWSLKLGNIKGTAVKIHWTFILFLAWIVVAAYGARGAQAALGAGLFFMLLFASVLLHEFGHILTARHFGVRTPDVTLLPIGGVARLERIPEEPRQELLIALAGSAVNFVIGGVLALLLGGLPAHTDMEVANLGRTFWTHLAWVNLGLGLFNLLPAFPMDGGRALRAILSWKLGYARGTRTAAVTGQVLAVLLGLAGVASGNLMLTLIAVFVYVAAGAEAGAARLRSASLGALASDVMITRFETFPSNASVEKAAEALIHTHQKMFPVLAADGRLLGIATKEQIANALRHGAADGSVADIMSRDIPKVTPSHLADHILELLQAGAPAVAVIDAGGALAGMVTLDSFLEYVLLSNTRHAGETRTITVPHVSAGHPIPAGSAR